MLKRLYKFISSSGSAKKSTNSVNEIPSTGFHENSVSIPFIDSIDQSELDALNNLLPWKAFVADKHGRRFGNYAWSGKRVTPQLIPDPRHLILNDRIPLKDKTVLEIGCFEGIHTISLSRLAKSVVAIDSRMENVVKTMVRCGFFNATPTVFLCDVEKWSGSKALLRSDVCHHIGVLYHLKDPVAHLKVLASLTSEAIFLDTHVAGKNDLLETYTSGTDTFMAKRYKEGGLKDVFSGMYDHAWWLQLSDLILVLKQLGFSSVEVIEEREERNGPRILLLAKR